MMSLKRDSVKDVELKAELTPLKRVYRERQLQYNARGHDDGPVIEARPMKSRDET